MANLPQQGTVNQYIADGATSVFIYSYLILLDTDLLVYLTPPNTTPDPTADLQVLNVDYTVQGVGTESGGTVTFINMPTSNSIVTIVRNIQASIDTEYNQARNINGQNLDDDFGRITLVSQQISSNFGTFGLQYTPSSIGYTGSNGINPTSNVVPRLLDNQIWVGQNGGVIAATLEQNPDVSVLRSQLASEANGSDGTTIIGYYDTYNSAPGTLNTFLNALYPTIDTKIASAAQKSSATYAIDTGTVNHIVVAPTPAYETPFVAGDIISFLAANTNTGDTDITIGINAPQAIRKQTNAGLSILQPYDITVGFLYTLIHNGSQFQLMAQHKPNIFALITMNNSQSLPNDAADHKINYNLLPTGYNPFSIVDLPNNAIIAPITGLYKLDGCYNTTNGGNNTGSLFLNTYVNGTKAFRFCQMTFGTDNQSVIGSKIILLNQGDAVTLSAANTGGAAATTIGNTSDDRSNCWFSLTYIGT